MATLHTPLCDLVGIEYPIIQAPMAGGPTTPELVTAVSAAGDLGSFGHAYTAAETIRSDANGVRTRTARPFNLNLFVAPVGAEVPLEQQRAAIAGRMAPPAAVAALPPSVISRPPTFDGIR